MNAYTVFPAWMAICLVMLLAWHAVMAVVEKRKRVGRLAAIDGFFMAGAGLTVFFCTLWIVRTWTVV